MALKNARPYMLQELIVDPAYSGQATGLTTAKATLEADIQSQGYTFICPQCSTTGQINAQTQQCPTCNGYGYTPEQQVPIIAGYQQV